MIQALTHSSYANEQQVESNERLELLGDAVISLACIDYLYKNYPSADEGVLTQLKTNMVNGKQLAEVGAYFNLDKYVRLGEGEVVSKKTLGRTVEAVVGASFLAEGYERTRNKLSILFKRLESGEIAQVTFNYKGELQKYFQSVYKVDPAYKLVKTTGPAHDRRYCVKVTINGADNTFGYGHGTSVKEAEQEAARSAISLISEKS